jgi:hypothetical protein
MREGLRPSQPSTPFRGQRELGSQIWACGWGRGLGGWGCAYFVIHCSFEDHKPHQVNFLTLRKP